MHVYVHYTYSMLVEWILFYGLFLLFTKIHFVKASANLEKLLSVPFMLKMDSFPSKSNKTIFNHSKFYLYLDLYFVRCILFYIEKLKILQIKSKKKRWRWRWRWCWWWQQHQFSIHVQYTIVNCKAIGFTSPTF